MPDSNFPLPVGWHVEKLVGRVYHYFDHLGQRRLMSERDCRRSRIMCWELFCWGRVLP